MDFNIISLQFLEEHSEFFTNKDKCNFMKIIHEKNFNFQKNSFYAFHIVYYKIITFFAFFLRILKYAIVRTLSVCLSVCLSVIVTTFHEVDRLGLLMGQLIAYDPRTLTKEGFFLDRSWTGWEGSEVQSAFYFI
jgi:hypothetical protein